MNTKHLTLFFLVSTFACTDITNPLTVKGDLDLSLYTSAPSTPLNAGDVFRTVHLGDDAIGNSAFVFLRLGELWSADRITNDEGRLQSFIFRRVGSGGEILETELVLLSELGLDWYDVHGVTADASGVVWLSFAGESQIQLAGVELATHTLVRSLSSLSTRNSSTFGYHAPLTFGGDRLFVASGSDVVAIDLSTGTAAMSYKDAIGSGFSSGDATQLTSLGFHDGVLLMMAGQIDADALAVDAATGAVIGHVACGYNQIGTADDGFFGIGPSGVVEHFAIDSTPVPAPAIEAVYALSNTHARGLTAIDGEVWIFYADVMTNEMEFVSYDPATMTPTGGFGLEQSVTEELQHTVSGYWFRRPHSIAADAQNFYVGSALIQQQAQSTDTSQIHVISRSSGGLAGVFNYPALSAMSLCHDGTDLVLGEVTTLNGFQAYAPVIQNADSTNGVLGASETANVVSRGMPGVACFNNGKWASTDQTRLWATSTGSFFAVPYPGADSGVAQIDGHLFVLDRERSIVVQSSVP